MERSTNSFSRLVIDKSTNTFASASIDKSSNKFSGNKQGELLEIGRNHGWDGENITDAAITDDLNFGNQFGLFGAGIKHFEKLK